MLELIGLYKTFNPGTVNEKRAINGLNLTLEDGDFVTIIGGNGAGKSTTLNTISGLLRSKTGSIEFMGQSLAKVPSHKIVERGLALVPEGRRIFLQMTVQENLEMGAFTQKGGETQQDLEKIYALFPRLKERLKQMAGTLSGGEQQMLAIGRALMADPEILLLDEPSLGLAPLIIQDIFKTLQAIRSEGTTILMVEQNALATLKIADYGYVLELGKISMHGPASQLVRDERLIEAYLGNKK